jgi:hypothetical protein
MMTGNLLLTLFGGACCLHGAEPATGKDSRMNWEE